MGYYKPTDLLSGDPWKNHYRDPKTKEIRFYQVYGGKLAGLLTQSLCREIFFASLRTLSNDLKAVSNAQIVGQFHDEIVVEWQPLQFKNKPGYAEELSHVIDLMSQAMSYTDMHGFPLAAEIKHDHRYTK